MTRSARYADDIAQTIMAALDMPRRALWPELAVLQTIRGRKTEWRREEGRQSGGCAAFVVLGSRVLMLAIAGDVRLVVVGVDNRQQHKLVSAADIMTRHPIPDSLPSGA